MHCAFSNSLNQSVRVSPFSNDHLAKSMNWSLKAIQCFNKHLNLANVSDLFIFQFRDQGKKLHYHTSLQQNHCQINMDVLDGQNLRIFLRLRSWLIWNSFSKKSFACAVAWCCQMPAAACLMLWWQLNERTQLNEPLLDKETVFHSGSRLLNWYGGSGIRLGSLCSLLHTHPHPHPPTAACLIDQMEKQSVALECLFQSLKGEVADSCLNTIHHEVWVCIYLNKVEVIELSEWALTVVWTYKSSNIHTSTHRSRHTHTQMYIPASCIKKHRASSCHLIYSGPAHNEGHENGRTWILHKFGKSRSGQMTNEWWLYILRHVQNTRQIK